MFRRIFRAYMMFLFIMGHVAVIIGAGYVFAKIGSPMVLLRTAMDKVKKSNPEVASLMESVTPDGGAAKIDFFKFPEKKEWKGAGASPDRQFWIPAYDKFGKPLAAGAPERGLLTSTVARDFPLRIVNVKTADELGAAVSQAKPGDAIIIAPGKYFMSLRSFGANTDGLPKAPIAIRAEKLGSVRYAHWNN